MTLSNDERATIAKQIKELESQIKRAKGERVSIVRHVNGRVNVTFTDLTDNKNYTTNHTSLKAATKYFTEIGDYIEETANY